MHALRNSLRASPAFGTANRIQRGLAIRSLAWLAWGVVLVVAMIMGKSASGGTDGPITLFLLLVAAVAFFYARKVFTQSPDPHAKRRPVVAAALWGAAGFLTLFALIALGSD